MSAHYQLSRIKLATLCDFIKSDGFRYPLAKLSQEMWDNMRTDENYKKIMVGIGKIKIPLEVKRQINAKFVHKPAYYYEYSIQVDVLHCKVLALIRDPSYNVVEPSSSGLDFAVGLMAIAGALCVEDEERFQKWAEGIYGPLIDIVHNIEEEERLRRRAISLERLDNLRYSPLYPGDMNPRSIPHALSGITYQETIRRYQKRKLNCLLLGIVKQYY